MKQKKKIFTFLKAFFFDASSIQLAFSRSSLNSLIKFKVKLRAFSLDFSSKKPDVYNLPTAIGIESVADDEQYSDRNVADPTPE